MCIIGGVANALPVPVASALSVEEGRKIWYGLSMGVFNMGNGIGMAVGPLIVGLILDFVNINSVFYFGAGIGLLGTALFMWFTR